MKPELLLVEDEKNFARSLQNILSHHNYNCTIATNGNQAISLLKKNHYDIALLDVGLPDISGCTVAEYINANCPKTVAVMLTGLNDVEVAVKAMKQGAYDFLNKPVEQHQLIRTLNKALEHNALKNELRVSEKRFQTLAKVAWEGIVIFADTFLLEANTQFYKMFGYHAKELEGDDFLAKILTPLSLDAASQNVSAVQPTSMELTGVRKDGSQFPIQAKLCMIEYLGRPARVMILRDISDLLRFEEEKRLLQKKLANANKLKALGMMAGSVAHDLNNILTAVVSYPELLLRQMDTTDKYYDEIKKIQQAGKLAASVVSDLVSTVRGGVRTSIVSDLNNIIYDHLSSIEHSERLIKFPGITVETDLTDGLYHIECSPEHISKLLLNLIGNAMESIKTGGTIKVTTSNHEVVQSTSGTLTPLLPGKYVKLVVADNGAGISPVEIDYIFDPFYTTKNKSKSGTGLGLSIVWNVVKEHNGDIEVKNLYPGAAFEVYLPATSKPILTKEREIFKESFMGNGELILLVDDQPEQNVLMKRMLAILGYETHATESGEQAIAFLQENKADLIILDMHLGKGLNGRQTLEAILKNNRHQRAMIISGYCDEEEFLQTKKLGITTFLEKPVSLSVVSKAVRENLIKELITN